MANEDEIALEEPAEPETEAAHEQTPVSQPEAEPAEDTEEAPQPEPDAPAVVEAERETGCPTGMGLFGGPRCGRKLHAAPAGVDKQPVCLMHSKDPNKQSGELFDAFWQEFERILEEAGENDAHFEYFVFPLLKLRGRKFEVTCKFVDATFTQDADFVDVKFMQDAGFYGATFAQYVNFTFATFMKDADFFSTSFEYGASFLHATFAQKADFWNATFMKDTNFCEAIFKRNADFAKATFEQIADLSEAIFTQKAIFEQSKFYETVDWSECRFLDQAEFRHTKFLPKEPMAPSAVFSLAKFAKPGEVVFEDVDLSRALFINCDVSAVWFTSSVKWATRKGHRGLAVFEEEILLKPKFIQLQEKYGKIDHGAVEQIYHQLQKNYDTRLDYRKANDFHYGEMEMRRLEPPSGGRFLSLRQRIPRWLNLLSLYRLASDYGNSYAKPGTWLLATLLAAMLAFPITGLELKQPKPGNPANNAIVTYGGVWNQQDTWTNNLWTEGKLVIKSGITAIDTATFQRNPEYTPVYPRGRILGIIETLLTSSLFALFLLAIRRQFRR